MHINRHSFNGVDYVLESDCNAKIAAFTEEIELLRVQLAGCGVAAMQNTESTVKDRAVDGDYGYSASYSDVCKAVDREIKYREALKRIIEEGDYTAPENMKHIAKVALEI